MAAAAAIKGTLADVRELDLWEVPVPLETEMQKEQNQGSMYSLYSLHTTSHTHCTLHTVQVPWSLLAR
jgi:hypothetical protein